MAVVVGRETFGPVGRWLMLTSAVSLLAVRCSARTPRVITSEAVNGGVTGTTDVAMAPVLAADRPVTVVGVVAVSDTGLEVTVPGSCDPGCPGGPMPWNLRYWAPDLHRLPLHVLPGNFGGSLVRVAHVTDAGKEVLARGSCLYVRASDSACRRVTP